MVKSKEGGRCTFYNGLYGEAPPERGTFFTLEVYKTKYFKKFTQARILEYNEWILTYTNLKMMTLSHRNVIRHCYR